MRCGQAAKRVVMAEPFTRAQLQSPFGFEWDITLHVPVDSELVRQHEHDAERLLLNLLSAYRKHIK